MEHPLRRPELLTCAWFGHVLDAGATRSTTDDRYLAPCRRCESWIITRDRPVPTAVVPRRGKALRQAIVVRLIALDRTVHMVAFAAVTVAALALRAKVDALHSWATSMIGALDSARTGSGGASSHGLIAALLTRLSHLSEHSLLVIAAFAGVYTVVSGFEAVGLWRERRWAEYLTVLATAGFLPIEIHELIARVTFVRVLALTVNLAIVVYLVWTKHLFGIGGKLVPEPAPVVEPLPDLSPVPT
ncbi:MAG TPA: DUF2127 domain-containing protein [Acidimicrobiia bacterium]|nr:DUF2127 domain-containing protein [Acidimicrobiia bacterium]